MSDALLILFAALMLDLLLGDPVYPAHPVRLIGRLISFLEHRIYPVQSKRIGGTILWISATIITLVCYALLLTIIPSVPLCIFLLYSTLSMEDLFRHIRAVQLPLAMQDEELARQKLRAIVGRDVQCLNRSGIARASIECLAESFVDSILSPLFWYLIGALIYSPETGVALALAFKVTNTLDSMVGYKNKKYRRFGTISARMDDLLNFIPARLSIPLITLSALICHQSAKQAWRIGWRDRWNHTSPNSAHPEAAVAGAIGLKLGGPTQYPDGLVDKPWLGDGEPSANPNHIEQALHLIRTASLIAFSLAMILIALNSIYTKELLAE
jgi:adenosylcobinamide-phosphate synthase